MYLDFKVFQIIISKGVEKVLKKRFCFINSNSKVLGAFAVCSCIFSIFQ